MGSIDLNIPFYKEVMNQFEAKARVLNKKCNTNRMPYSIYLAYIMACWCMRFKIKYSVQEWYDGNHNIYHFSIMIGRWCMNQPPVTESNIIGIRKLGYLSPRQILKYFKSKDNDSIQKMHPYDKKVIRKEVAESWRSGRLEKEYPFLKNYRWEIV